MKPNNTRRKIMNREQELTDEQLISELEKSSEPTEKEFVTVRLRGAAMDAVDELRGTRTPSETANILVKRMIYMRLCEPRWRS